MDDSDESDFEAAITQDFLRELEAEDNLQRRANMSPEERMQEKERLAKAAGKPGRYLAFFGVGLMGYCQLCVGCSIRSMLNAAISSYMTF